LNSNKEIVLVGYSGHGFVVAEAAICSGLNLKFYCEKKAPSLNPFELSFIGFEGDNNFTGWDNDYEFILGIGDNNLREKTGQLILQKNKNIVSVIHPDARVSKNINMGVGVFIARNGSVNPLAEIKDFAILNTGCIVEHECKIGKAAHIAPGAVLAGNVSIGNRTFVGANSVIKQGIVIGDDVIIGAGSVVLRDVPNNSKIAGNPAKTIK